MLSISVIGAGAWGTALALATLRAHHVVRLIGLCDEHGHPYSPPHPYTERVSSIPGADFTYTTDSQAATGGLIILAPPAQYMRATCTRFTNVISPTTPLIIASKGIENTTALLMSEVVRDVFPHNPILILSGPSFAEDVAQNLPTAVALAGPASAKIAPAFETATFHAHPTDDVIGVELGGALKNVIAVACGIVAGRKQGENARAAVLAQGLQEIAHLGKAMGANPETFLGLAGVGDITLTSYSLKSRNTLFGLELAAHNYLCDLSPQPNLLAEGVHTVAGAILLAEKHKVSMPLTLALHQVLNKEGSIEAFIKEIL